MNFENGLLNALEKVTGAHAVITTDHAFIHEGKAFTLSGKMDVAATKTGAVQLTVPGAVAASLTTNMTAATSDITLPAKFLADATVTGGAGDLILDTAA